MRRFKEFLRVFPAVLGISALLSFTIMGVISLIIEPVLWYEPSEIIKVSEILLGCWGIAFAMVIVWRIVRK